MKWWTKTELLDHARSHGFDMTGRTFTNWVQRGLIANATRRGRGPGAGVASVWPESQAHLLLKLLEDREGTYRLASLAVIPISLWLYFGDDYVDTEQAMKAMKTWSKGYGTVSRRRAAGPARELAEQLGGPDVDPRLRNRLVELVQDLAPSPESFDRDALIARFEDLLAESPNKLPISAEGLVFLIEARFRAARHIDEYSRAEFVAARTAILTTLAGHQQMVGVDSPEFVISERLLRSALDLAAHLGMNRLSTRQED